MHVGSPDHVCCRGRDTHYRVPHQHLRNIRKHQFLPYRSRRKRGYISGYRLRLRHIRGRSRSRNLRSGLPEYFGNIDILHSIGIRNSPHLRRRFQNRLFRLRRMLHRPHIIPRSHRTSDPRHESQRAQGPRSEPYDKARKHCSHRQSIR